MIKPILPMAFMLVKYGVHAITNVRSMSIGISCHFLQIPHLSMILADSRHLELILLNDRLLILTQEEDATTGTISGPGKVIRADLGK